MNKPAQGKPHLKHHWKSHRKPHRDGTTPLPRQGPPWLEWAAAGLGLAITAGVFGSIAWQAMRDPTAPPVIVVEVERAAPVQGGWRVEVRARNLAGSTAAGVEVEGVLAGDGDASETGRLVFDYIPGYSSRRGGLFFTREPQPDRLALRALGYATP